MRTHAHTHTHTHTHTRTRHTYSCSIPTTMMSLKRPWTCVRSRTKLSATTTTTWMNFYWTCCSYLTTVSSTTSVTQRSERTEQLWRDISKSAAPIWDWRTLACVVRLWTLALIIQTRTLEESPLEIKNKLLRFSLIFTWASNSKKNRFFQLHICTQLCYVPWVFSFLFSNAFVSCFA